MAEPIKYPYRLDLAFASGHVLDVQVTCTSDEAERLRQAVHDKVSNITIGDAASGAIVIDARNLDYFQMSRGIIAAGGDRHTGDAPRSTPNR